MNGGIYTMDFQRALLFCLLKDQDFFVKVGHELRLSDFGVISFRLMFEVARNYYLRFGALPSAETLFLLVEAATKAPDPLVTTSLPYTDTEFLVDTLQRYYVFRPSSTDVQFYESQLQGYLATMRWLDIDQSGMSAQEKIVKAAQIQDDINRVNTSAFKLVSASAPIPEEERSSGTRYGFGVSAIDSKIARGLMRKQMGLVVACTGVGKTTSMTGAMAYSAATKVGSLYITLEMNAARIQERYQGILAGIPASYFKAPISTWPEAYRKRYAAVVSPKFGLMPYATVCDMSFKDFGVLDIEQAIIAWKTNTYRAGLDPDTVCTNVYVDWLDRLDSEGVKKINKNSSEERVWAHILEKLYQMINKHNISMWIATQGKPEAKGKDVLTLKDVAWGGSKAHLMDVVIGLAPTAVDEKVKDAATEVLGENEDTVAPECNRRINCSFMKTRDTSAVDTHVTVYQDPTLRLWNQQSDALKRQAAILRDPFDGFRDVI